MLRKTAAMDLPIHGGVHIDITSVLSVGCVADFKAPINTDTILYPDIHNEKADFLS